MDKHPKILIIDDHPTFVDGLSLLLQSIFPNADIVTAHTGASALQKTEQCPDFDWILLDFHLPDCNGIDLVGRFTEQKLLANIIVITSETEPAIIDQALNHNINGFLTKDFDHKTLMDCIKAIDNGQEFLLPEYQQQLNNYRNYQLRETQNIQQNISPRQQETLLMLSKGFSNQEIAQNMHISESTVKTHVSSLMTLFEADNRTHCVSEAQRLNIIN